MNLRRFLSLLVFGLALALPAGADVFRVTNIAVDETAASGREARDKAYSVARMRGAQRLVERLTLPEDRAAASSPIQYSDIARFGTKVDRMSDEKSTSTRFITVLGIGFDASTVRAYLDARGVPFVDSQAGLSLVVPVVSGTLDPALWTETWRVAADDTSLTPFRVSATPWTQKPAWDQIAPEIASNGTSRAILAELVPLGTGMTVRVSEVRAGQAETPIATLGPFPDMPAAQAAVIRELETAWKKSTVVRTTGVTSMAVVAGFRDVTDWIRIRKGLETSRIIKEIKVESLSALGADISFVFAGRPDQLAADLRSKGLTLSGTDDGWRLEAAPAQ
jgi:hypothetical protein